MGSTLQRRTSWQEMLVPAMRQSILAAGLIVLWTAAIRLPFAGNVGEDEVFYALVAQRWLAGLLPYVSSFDVKPPGLFAVFAGVQAVFGTSVGVLKGLEVGCVAVSAFGLFLLGRRRWCWRTSGKRWCASALTAWLSLRPYWRAITAWRTMSWVKSTATTCLSSVRRRGRGAAKGR